MFSILSDSNFDPSNYDTVVVYKFHFTWIAIFLLSLPVFKYLIGPWLVNSLELLGERILVRFFSKLFTQIELLKKEIKELNGDKQ